MKIRSAEIRHLEVPLQGTYSGAHHPNLGTMESLLLVLETADGVRGIGTSDAIQGYSKASHDETEETLANEFLPAVLERDFENPNQFKRFFDEIDGAANAKCAIESAFIDLYGKARGETVADLLGGRLSDTVDLNAWVGFDEPDAMAAEAREWVDRGFGSMKIKFDGTAETDVQRARAVIDEVGDEAAVRADANEAYDLETAIEVAQALEDLPLVHFEQPIPGDDLNSLKELTESTSTTIMADECLTDIDQVRKALALGAADRLKLKILRLGGVMNTRIALDYAQLHGIECVVGHGFCLSPAASAEIQLVASHANVFGAAETVGPLKMATEPFDPVIDMSSGSVTLSDEPGLGVELVDDELESCTTNVRTVE